MSLEFAFLHLTFAVLWAGSSRSLIPRAPQTPEARGPGDSERLPHGSNAAEIYGAVKAS